MKEMMILSGALAETLAARIVVEKNYSNGAAVVTTAAAENQIR